MKYIQFLFMLITIMLTTACQSTQPTNQATSYNNPQKMNQGFKPLQTKRVIESDHQFAYSLANRALPQDQQMVLAFEKQKRNSLYAQEGFFVQIRGGYDIDSGKPTSQLAWKHYDANAKRISGPK